MTRRVVLAIVINVWLVLLTAGVSTYYITRSLLLSDLDDSIISRVASLPEMARPDALPHLSVDAQDRWAILGKGGDHGSSVKIVSGDGVPAPVILTREFTQAGGIPMRTLKLQAYQRPKNPGDPPEQVVVVYSASMEHVDALLWKLLYSFIGFGVLAAVASIVVARAAAGAALRPMREAADIISHIDERTLDRRIDLKNLPPELAAVGGKVNDMLGRLEAAFAQRRQFLANASHELRTPVAALVTALEVSLRRRRDTDEYIRILDQSLSDARLLNQLVVALIEQARLDRLGDNPEFGPVPLSQILRRCTLLLAVQAHQKGIELICHIPVDATIFTDEGLLRSAILNLLSNAIEYTPPLGKITLSATMGDMNLPLPPAVQEAIPEGMASQPRQVEIAVRDNGPGIKPEHVTNIFEPFYRADASRTDSRHHLGLGLAAVRLNVRSLGGECSVESPPKTGGIGCIFRIQLPTAIMNIDKPVPVRNPASVAVREKSAAP